MIKPNTGTISTTHMHLRPGEGRQKMVCDRESERVSAREREVTVMEPLSLIMGY